MCLETGAGRMIKPGRLPITDMNCKGAGHMIKPGRLPSTDMNWKSETKAETL